MRTDDIVTVTSAEFHRNIGTYQDIALTKTVTITKNGREDRPDLRGRICPAQAPRSPGDRSWRPVRPSHRGAA
jgi:hypothetical protein